MFVCKQTVISFAVLFVLKCSFCPSFLFVVTSVRWQYIHKICVTVIRNVSQSCCQNRCIGSHFIFFTRASSSKTVRKWSRLLLELMRAVESASAKLAPCMLAYLSNRLEVLAVEWAGHPADVCRMLAWLCLTLAGSKAQCAMDVICVIS